ncbi:Immune-associated nucleotide-binding protein 9 [Citrus sinensis]|uniref:Immune-associated nucleotide-binding protein 9 n=1 Tax=Citrus sinensis TaxID=2711 RepID=A0ACB8M6Q9_CITSI|nr:Immune-associated nucleotide-binding protein 9 [Citrus sinensis]
MGERVINGDWKPTSSSNGERTVVLLGRTGNGKSATGNSILGRRAFKASAGSSAITKTCEMKTTVLKDGQVVNVIDTPGLFDSSAESEYVSKEIAKCIGMAKDGIQAVLLVFSVRSRFSQEEEAAVHRLQTLFGKKIFDYMIVVFTGGDDLEDNEKTLEDYLGLECPKPLKEILQLCDNRWVLFDNKTKYEAKRTEQVQQLLSLVNAVNVKNGGQPYTNECFAELKRKSNEEIHRLRENLERAQRETEDQLHKSYEDRIKRITEMVESRLKETTTRLEQQLAEEQAARLKVEGVESKLEETITRVEQQLAEEQATRLKEEEVAQLAQRKSNEEIHRLRENLERAQRETEDQLHKSYEDRIKRITEMVESKLKEMTTRLEQQLAKEQAARLKGEEAAQLAQRKSNDEIHKLRENLERAQRETEDQMHESYEDQIKRITEMVESKLKQTTTRLEQQLAEEQTARLKGEEFAQLAQRKSNVEIHKLRENLERAQRETEDQMHESYEDQIKRITEMVESKLKETTIRLEQQLEEEHAARLKADGATQLAQMKSNDEIRKLRENLERAEWEAEELRKRAEKEGCAIL